jgi:GLPGLI family protein
MNKFIFFLICIFSLSLSAQSIKGKAYYISKTKANYNSNISTEKRKELDERAKRLFDKKLVLSFNQSESFYREEESLDDGGNAYRAGYLAATSGYVSNGIYKNTENKTFIEQREFLGKLFLVKDSLPKFNWKLENESKKIGDYTVFKATMIRKIDSTDYRMINTQNFKSDGNIIVTAWYTPQIPVHSGPDIYGGLPGLILELNIYRTTILCSKIILNTANSEEIKPSKNGEVVSLSEFDKIAKEKRKEQHENFIKN